MPKLRRSPSEEFAARAEAIKRKHSGERPAVQTEPGRYSIEDPDTFDELKAAEVMTKLRINDTMRPFQSTPVNENFPPQVREQIAMLILAAQSDRVEFHRMYREFQEQGDDTILFVCLSLYLSGRSLVWKEEEWKVTLCKEEQLRTGNPVIQIHRPRLNHPSDQKILKEEIPLADVLVGLKM